MSSNAQRAMMMATGGIALVLANGPAAAQADRSAVLNVLVECAKIDDPSARLACYDNNIRSAGGIARNTIPGQTRAQGGGAPLARNSGPQGFGGERLRTTDGARAQRSDVKNISTKVTAVTPRQPGIYLLTLQDGAQWVFAQGVDVTYRLPRAGSSVDIYRAAMGSYLMRFDGQQPVQVLRVR